MLSGRLGTWIVIEQARAQTLEDGRIKIRQKGKTLAFASFPVGKVPNAFLFVRLFESTRQGRSAGAPAERATRGGTRNVG